MENLEKYSGIPTIPAKQSKFAMAVYTTPIELETLIDRHLITRETVRQLVEVGICEVTEVNHCFGAALGISFYSFPKNGFIIRINKNQCLEERELTLVHEIVHCLFQGDVYGDINCHKVETIIEREAQRFYSQNRQFVHELYAQLLAKPNPQVIPSS